MLKKSVWVVTSLLVILALGLSACSKTPTTTTPTSTTTTANTTTTAVTTTAVQTTTAPTTTTTPVVTNQPQYGGKYTFVIGNGVITGQFDPVLSSIGGYTAAVAYDKLVSADWAKGPEGTNEFNFAVPYIPESARTGVIAESWEYMDLHTVTWHIRHGINFQSKAPANGKQLTAADVLFSFMKGQQNTGWTYYNYCAWTDTALLATKRTQAKGAGRTDAEIDNWIAYLRSINYPYYATVAFVQIDQWTVQMKTLSPGVTLLDYGSWLFVQPTEAANVDMNNYRNECGTGPFFVSDMVPDSSITWTRNPNYWMTDPVHPGNKLPYLDTVSCLIIVDQSTQIAALRTHKIDTLSVPWDKAISIKQTNPELLSKVQSPTGAIVLFMRTDIAPFKDVRIRQALCMGIDRDSIITHYYKGNAVPDAWPVLPGMTGWTPIAQMPSEVKQLYEYHPDIAKQLLSDAGYPNGFTTEVDVYQSDPDVELVTLVAEQLKTINVTANIKVLEPSTASALLYNETYPQMIYSYWGNASPQAVLSSAHGGNPASIYSFSKVQDPLATAAYGQWSTMTDRVAAAKLLSQEYLREDLLAWEIPLPTSSNSTMWAPYVQGYHGEVSMGLSYEMGSTELVKFLWIDSKLRSSTIK